MTTPCYYCEVDNDVCKTCIHSDVYEDPQDKLDMILNYINIDKDGDGFICKEALDEVRKLCGS